MINSAVNFLWLLGFPDLLTHTIYILCVQMNAVLITMTGYVKSLSSHAS